MFKASLQTLEQFKQVLTKLSPDVYIKSCATLSDASIGQHSRHIIELYQVLIDGYEEGTICYDKRKRDKQIEQDLNFAIQQIQLIQNSLEKNNKTLLVSYELDNRNQMIDSNYYREVMYNLEHAIHHEALIKVAIAEFCDIILPESFGVAPSTLQFRNLCAQ